MLSKFFACPVSVRVRLMNKFFGLVAAVLTALFLLSAPARMMPSAETSFDGFQQESQSQNTRSDVFSTRGGLMQNNQLFTNNASGLLVSSASFADYLFGLSNSNVTALVDTVQFNTSGYTVNENSSTVVVTVTRTGDLSSTGSVNFSTSSATAVGGASCTAGVDYINSTGVIIFSAGIGSQTVAIPICDDVVFESNKSFTVNLFNAINLSVGSPSTATVAIIDNEAVTPGTFQFNPANYSINEGNSGTTIVSMTITRTGGSTGAVSLNYTTVNGTAVGGAGCSPGVDYINSSGTITFPNGLTSQTFVVPICNDTIFEINKTFTVNLSNPTAGATIGATGTATVTIINDDAAPCSYSLSPASPRPIGAPAVSLTLTVTTQAGCSWTASSNSAWITVISGASGTATGTVAFNVDANNGSARSGSLTVAGQNYVINQMAPSAQQPVIDSISPTSISVPTQSGASFTGTITITGSNFQNGELYTDGNLMFEGTSVVNGSGTTISRNYRAFCCVSNNQTFNFFVSTPNGQTPVQSSFVHQPSISGNVKSDGANLAGVIITLSGGQSASTLTDANGNYALPITAGGSYVVSVSKNGIGFNPASQTFNNLQTNQTANFQNGTPFCAPSSPNLIARWRGENNAADETGLNNGTPVSLFTLTAGRVGRSYKFDGNASRKITVPDSAALALTQSMTFEGWLKFDAYNTSANNNLIARKDDNALSTAYNLVINNAGKLGFWVAPTNGTPAAQGVEAPQALVAGRFYHFAVTVDDATDKYTIYINGAQVSQLTTMARPFGSLNLNSNPRIEIGGSNYNGILDELGVYNRALSASEVAAIYTAGSAGVCTPSTAAHRLDATFGNGGKVTAPIVTTGFSAPLIPYDSAYSTAIQADGKIVVAGTGGGGLGTSDFTLARYNADGSFDTTFGTGGKVFTSIGNGDIAQTVAIQPDGKIIAAGYTIVNQPNDGFALVRYNRDGSLDATFGSGGKVVTPNNGSISSIAVQADGKVIVGGTISSIGPVLARYSSDGSLDTTFGTNGVLNIPVNGKITLQTDGKIIVGGSLSVGSNTNFALARYNGDGSPDTAFGTNGVTSVSVGTGNSTIGSLVIQTDGKIVAAGSASNGANNDFALARFDAAGLLDASYGINGSTLTPVGNFNENVRAAVIQSDGKIVILGVSNNGSYNSFAAARYNTNGVLDTTYGTDGKIVTPLGNSNASVRAAAIQSNGKILVAGESFVEISGISRTVFTLVRYNADTPGAINPENNIALNFGNSASPGSTTIAPLTPAQLPALPSSFALTSSAQAFEINTSVPFSGSITVTFNVPSVAYSSICSSLRLLHFENGAWTDAGNGTPIYNSATQICTLTQTVTSLSPFAVAQVLAPTAASVSVGGRVMTADGAGIRNAFVTLTNSSGNSRTILTGKLGGYSFADVAAGETYVISVRAKRFSFSQPSQMLTITEDLTNINFIADEN